jgi:hypothetical protein
MGKAGAWHQEVKSREVAVETGKEVLGVLDLGQVPVPVPEAQETEMGTADEEASAPMICLRYWPD